MSFNGSGVFSINTTGQPVVAGTTISASVFNAFTADIATGLSTCLLKDGTQTATAVIPFAAGLSTIDSATSIYDNSDVTKIAQFQCSGITTGTTRTYTFPDASSTFALIGLAQTFSALQTFSAGITLSGTASNIALGSNYISNGGTDAGLSFDASNNATMTGTLALPSNGLNVGSGQLQVTGGNVSVSGRYISTAGNNALAFLASSATTGYSYAQIINGSGGVTWGVEGSSGGQILVGSSAYDAVLRGQSGIAFSANDGATMQMRLSSAGLSITGTLSSTGTIKAGGYTVATLPANAAGIVAYVTDQNAAAAAKGVAPAGGGAVVCYVMNTGAGWVGI